MAPPGELDSLAVAVTSALLGLQGSAPLVPLVTKDSQASLETLDPQASQVRLDTSMGPSERFGVRLSSSRRWRDLGGSPLSISVPRLLIYKRGRVM